MLIIEIEMGLDGKIVNVTGCTGFLGSTLMRLLEQENCEVRGISHADYDLRRREDVERAFDNNPDFVFHAAAMMGGISLSYTHPADLFYNNLLMTTFIIDVAKDTGVEKIINPLSNSSYPMHKEGKLKEDDLWEGTIHESAIAFGMTKRLSCIQAWAYKKQHNLDIFSLILPNMYGPFGHFEENRAHALNALIKKFVDAKELEKETVIVWGTGTPIREWLYVEDGARAMIKAANISYPEPVNIGLGKGISMSSLAEIIKDVTEFKGKIEYDTSKPDGVPYKAMDNTRMKEIFNWVPETNLREGIIKTVEWYIKNKKRR
ncbi:NAD-dependent epimerase/dehydratase family protein [Candidatus Pacearchaeota archaeon]|nr:NAD-dependent epimerase/dehydratase family protein [Candidatus Pacearchaeota archaeon]